MSVEFTDNTAKIKAALSEGDIGFLHEAGGAIQAQTQRNSRVDTGQTKGSYKYMVDEGKDESTVAVGSDLENAIWEEFGTGEYALHGDGRKGGWVYKLSLIHISALFVKHITMQYGLPGRKDIEYRMKQPLTVSMGQRKKVLI